MTNESKGVRTFIRAERAVQIEVNEVRTKIYAFLIPLLQLSALSDTQNFMLSLRLEAGKRARIYMIPCKEIWLE